MSKLSVLAKGFERSAIEQSRATDAAVTSALEQHESALRQALSESERRTSAAIRAGQNRLSAVALGGWLTLIAILAGTLALSAGALWWQGREILDNQAELQRQGATIEQLRAQGGAVKLNFCGEERRLCAAISPSTEVWGENEEYRILEGY